MKNSTFFFLLIAIFLVAGCNEIDRGLLTKSWKGHAILFNKEPSDMDPALVRLAIRPDGTYSFTDVVGNSQNGTFRTNKMGVLYLNPADGFEKAWEVVKLTKDSLVLKVETVTKKYEMVLVPDE